MDRDALAKTIQTHLASDGAVISRLGYFCAPFRPESGPFSDKVIKVYRGISDGPALDRLAQAHQAHVAALSGAGVPMPDTDFVMLDEPGGRIPVVVQKALPVESLMRPQMISADREGALALMQAAGEVIATFWHAAEKIEPRIGFHPSIRNFAVIDGSAVFFDTFPPLIGYSRDEMGQMLLTFSDSRLMRWVGPLMQRRITGIQDEWYSPAETLVGIVGSACRLRPHDADAFLNWGRDFAATRMAPWAEEAIAGMQEPPKLPGYWTRFRSLLGLQGAPNVGGGAGG